jgi:segregation and condensation protein A
MEKIINTNEFKMNSFDGPLDLLVSLIKDHKKDIMEINISEITQQYLDYINQNIKDILIDEASDFILMATYLIDLKAKTLIPHLNPQSNKNETEFEIEKFKRRIFLYAQYKNVVSELREKQFERFKKISKLQDEYEKYYLENIPDAPLAKSISIDKIIYS